ncbi:general secretion pathway protein GspG [Pseudomonas fluorescens]|jgi:general secretion pathway protein G|uniref:Type II secretion system protein n=1 Tax=Pseudomonas fluorescens TaxID=294 RepID=A0A1B3DFY3_PSEFL|nr:MULTISPECIES: type II secretion system protein [Pseudomonas]AOE70422.1 general secretion pathway protein GspG [Pseudomonas fluorescens]AOE76197.1 general secretion pathway protein GspG [Pseudomonas fluorescens]MDR6577981.1 general secretion pathway protein G [Pseudomonas extremaustralis]PMX20095.1 prepilin peptidase-dependent pilin [Pseudomonas sp. GW460-12]PMX37281.1 prepilin peptidase-dependent pilin [Pseudomonas sp. MPR-R2A4]
MWQGPPSHHCAKGFTLIELLLTLALLATLSTVAYPLTALMGKRDRELDLQRSLREIRRAIDSYKEAADDGRIQKSIGDSGYPPTLQALVEGVTDQTDLKGKKLFFLRRIPRDPVCECPELSPAQTWQLRSYQSSADNPQEGKDVFDVSSRSTRESLNGTLYSQW